MVELAKQAVGIPIEVAGLALDGSGVVIGLIDSGFDQSHPALNDAVLASWDQTTGLGPPPISEILTAPDRGLIDPIGHGTHLAGIAAGRVPPTGVAPGAGLALVRYNGRPGGLLRGAEYVFDVAGALGRPAVVSISQGGNHGDPHDGSDALSQGLDDLSGSGRLLCCAAGNESEEPLHVTLSVDPGVIVIILAVTVGSSELRTAADEIQDARISGWYTGDDPLGISVCHPRRGSGRVGVPPLEDSEGTGSIGGVGVQIQAARDPDNGNLSFAIRLGTSDGPFGDLPAATWILELDGRDLRAPTLVHMWSHDQKCLFWDHTKSLSGGRFPPSLETQPSHMIARPAAARSAIAVAAMTTRDSWHGPLGDRRLPWPVGDVCSFSNRGPTRDGRPKPEVTAPGAAILSLQSRQASYQPAQLTDGDRVSMFGTSQATPVVAGILAILLQLRPLSTPDDARQLLRQASAVPGGDPDQYDPAWGYGCVNMYRLYEAIQSYDADS